MSSGYIEQDLSMGVRNVHRALASLQEELEAIDYYHQRADRAEDGELKAILIHSEVSRLEGQISSHNEEYKVVLDNQNKTADLKNKLQALRSLSANRLLQANLLNALQKTTVDDVQLLRIHVDQTYTSIEGTKTSPPGNAPEESSPEEFTSLGLS